MDWHPSLAGIFSALWHIVAETPTNIVFEIFWAGSYEGYWLDGYPHGFGKLWASSQGPMSGSYYVGIWFNGTTWDSEGTFQYPSGAKFKGIFNANGPVYGTITYKNGNTFTGVFYILVL